MTKKGFPIPLGWYDPRYYDKRIPPLFNTLRNVAGRNLPLLHGLLRVRGVRPSELKAFEIGPGYHPTIHLIEPRQATLIDYSTQTLKDLKEAIEVTKGNDLDSYALLLRELRKSNPGMRKEEIRQSLVFLKEYFHSFPQPGTRFTIARGDAKKLPLPKQAYHLGFLSEVLTHVNPSERESVVRQAAGATTRKLVIIDRHPQKLFTEEQGAVVPEKLCDLLTRLGFKVTIHSPVATDSQDRFVLVAERVRK